VALTGPSAAVMAGHEEHACSPVLERTERLKKKEMHHFFLGSILHGPI